MKQKLIALVLMAGFAGVSANAAFEQFVGPSAAINVWNTWNTNNYTFDGYQFYFAPGSVADLQALTTDNRQFELLPNTSTFTENASPPDPYWINTNSVPWTGNKAIEAVTVFEAPDVTTGSETNIVLQYTVDAFDLDPRWAARAEIRTFNADYSGFAQAAIGPWLTANDITNGTLELAASYPAGIAPNKRVQVVFVMGGLNANPTNVASYGSATVTFQEVIIDSGDQTPPDQPEINAVVAASDNKLFISSTTVTDDLTYVQYFFSNTVNGAVSGWQSDTNWLDDGLSASTPYSYVVKARDTSAALNETAWSAPATNSTLATSTALPDPSPMTFASSDASSQSVKLTATTAADALGGLIEYQFSNTVSGVASAWQSSPVYIVTSLASSSDYPFTVRARDLDAATNTTAWSDPLGVTTLAYPASVAVSDSLTGYTGNSNQDELVHEILKATFEFANYDDLNRRIGFDVAGATFGGFADGDAGRNVMRTLANEYASGSFTATVTAVNWQPGQNYFIGFGSGQLGAYGVPDWQGDGTQGTFPQASFICEFNPEVPAANVWSQSANTTNNNSATASDGSAIITAGATVGLRIVYDAATSNGTFIIDLDYDGVTFDENVTVGPVSAPDFGVWPSSIYIAGDDGANYKDLVIEAEGAAPIVGVADLAITPISGGMLLTWTSVGGQTYDVEYKTDLTSGSWTTELSGIAGTGGSISATSTVSASEAFYQVSTQ